VRGDALTGLCAVESLALFLYSTPNRISAPHKLSSVSLIVGSKVLSEVI
jgi:hypothetical protein